jgi:uncharacterized RDD family membrane protein YckC
VTSDTPGSGESLPPDPEPPSEDPGAVTAPYTPGPPPPPVTDPPPPATPPTPTSSPTGTGLPPGVGWASPVPVVQEVAPGLVFSSTGARFVAWFVDLVLLSILFAVIGTVLEAAGLRGGSPSTAFGDPGYWDTYLRADPIGAVLTVALSAVYFVGSWTGGRRATLGQRLLSIQVGNAFDGRSLTLEQAIRRWLGLGEILSLLGAVPVLAGLGSLLLFVWSIVLLITTATSPTKQGLHDKLANTAVVRPTGAGNTWVTGCLVIVLILALLTLLSIVALIFLGGQVSTILSTVGESV